MSLDTEELKTKLDTDESSVRALFAYNNDSDGLLDDGGYAVTTRASLYSYTRTAFGLFYKKSEDLDDEIDRLERKVYGKEDDLIKKEIRLFNNMVNRVQALQSLQAKGARISQINSIVMSSMM